MNTPNLIERIDFLNAELDDVMKNIANAMESEKNIALSVRYGALLVSASAFKNSLESMKQEIEDDPDINQDFFNKTTDYLDTVLNFTQRVESIFSAD